MKLTITVTLFLALYSVSPVWAQNFLPTNILLMDEKFSHHVIVVEKSTHKLFLYANTNGVPRLVSSFQIATGKNSGDKKSEGDQKTPEGYYQLTQFHPAEYLLKTYGDLGKIYGAGAFVLNYPNRIDRQNGKTGGGIWLHSTDDESRISKGLDSRGCVVVSDASLKEISRYIDLDVKTPIIVTETINYWSDATWTKNRDELLLALNSWLANWDQTKASNYLSFYDNNLFRDESGKNYRAWAEHKTRVFSIAKDTNVKMEYPSLMLHDDYAFVHFQQTYSSSLVRDTGKKVMIWKKDADYNWKIIYEGFESISKSGQLAFTPSQRYFR